MKYDLVNSNLIPLKQMCGICSHKWLMYEWCIGYFCSQIWINFPLCLPWTDPHLTHCSLVTPCGITDLGQHLFRWWFVTCSAPSHYLNQCWLTVSMTLTNLSEIGIKLQKFSLIKMYLKMLSLKWLPFCPGGVELNTCNGWLSRYLSFIWVWK